MDNCSKHHKPISHICTHPDCFKFVGLCNDCLEGHQKKHKNNSLNLEQQWIITRETCYKNTNQILNNLKEELEQTENKAANALINTVNSNIDEIILEIESIRQQINRLFEKYIQALKDKFEYKVKSSIHQSYDQIQVYLAQVKEFIDNSSQIIVQKRVNQTDLAYQVQYQKSRLENLIYQRANQKFQGKIDDDVALHFIGVIQKELDQLVIYNNSNKKRSVGQQQSIKNFEKFMSYNPSQLEQIQQVQSKSSYSFFKSWIFYFETGTKNLHYLDLKQKNSKLTTVQLDIPFDISQGSKSIIGSDGFIYYFHGYDDSQNEDEYRTIYLYDHHQLKFQPKARMITIRKNYSLTSNEGEIYIIGGQNYKEGCLAKCEKFNLSTNTVTIVNHLQEQSALHTSCNFNNQLIIKYGGLRAYIENENLRDYCREQLEVYDIEQDIWKSVSFTKETAQPSITISSISIHIPETDLIYIFGGQMALKNGVQSTNQGFKVQIVEEQEFDKADQIKSSLIFSYQLNHPTSEEFYFVCEPIIFQNQMHVLVKGREISHFSYQKSWKRHQN